MDTSLAHGHLISSWTRYMGGHLGIMHAMKCPLPSSPSPPPCLLFPPARRRRRAKRSTPQRAVNGAAHQPRSGLISGRAASREGGAREIVARSDRDWKGIGEPFHAAGHPAGLPEDHPDRFPPIASPRLRPSSSLMTTMIAPLIIRWTWIYRPSQQRPVGKYLRPRPWRRRRRRLPICSMHTAPRLLKSSPHAASSYCSSPAR